MSAPASGRAPFSHEWTVTLRVHVHPDGRTSLRDWLLANGEACPPGFANQLHWFVDCQLTGSADYEDVAISFELAECRPRLRR